jgi:hypothetical protein
MRTKRLPRHVVIRIAGSSDADPRTVQKFCDGDEIRGAVKERIEKALAAAGIKVVEPDAPEGKNS